MQTSKELTVFTANDLSAAGINSQLTSNDLIEVVAHDIYDKFVDAVTDAVKRGKQIEEEYSSLFDAEMNKMKRSLKKWLSKSNEVIKMDEDDIVDEDFEGVAMSFGKISRDDYWPPIGVIRITLVEKDKGTMIDQRSSNLYMPSLKAASTKVKFTISSGNQSSEEAVKVGSITGTIQTITNKSFTQIISVPTTRFKKIADKVKEHNKQVADLISFLPKNGLLSVERFTREARVKMNKKILSAQSPDFRKKISELFNIKL